MASLDSRAALSKWKVSLNYISSFPLLEEPNSSKARTPSRECGVSLAWLKQILDSLVKSDFSIKNCQDFVEQLVVPLTRVAGQRHRMWDLIPSEHVGKPQHYIIHAWTDPLEAIVESLCTFLTPHVEPGMPQPKGPSPEVMASTFLWLDIVAVSQHITAIAAQNGPDLAETRAALAAATQGSIAILAPGNTLLTRIWCMYECWASVYYGNAQRLQVLFPRSVDLADLSQFQDMCKELDLTRCEASRPVDKQKIVSEAKHAAGLKRVQTLLPDALNRSLRAGLRWGGNLRSLVMYCAMVLRAGESAQALTVLHSIPEIHDDEKMLQDIRNLFKVYDTDGSGELDEHEFVEVLCVAGFTQEEGLDMFSKVDVDGGGSVSLEEFEAWWIESQRQQSTRYHQKLDLNVETLVGTLKQLLQLLEREGLQELSQCFSTWLAKVSRCSPKRALTPSPIRGEWQQVAEQCAWHVNSRNYRAAAKQMWELLAWNADTLPANPMERFRHPDEVSDKIDALEALCDMFDDFGSLLQRLPSSQRQAEYFIRAAKELRDGELLDLMEAEIELEELGQLQGKSKPEDQKDKAKKNRRKTKKQLEREKVRQREQEQERELQRERNRLRALEEAENGRSPSLMRLRSRRNSQSRLQDPEAGAAEFIRRRTKGRQKRAIKLFPGKYDMQREAIVTNMVRLKYGTSTLLSNNMIVEAEKSLSEWMAAQKAMQGKGVKQDNRESVNVFTRQYLLAGNPNGQASLPDIIRRWGGDGDGTGSEPPMSAREQPLASGLPAVALQAAKQPWQRGSSDPMQAKPATFSSPQLPSINAGRSGASVTRRNSDPKPGRRM